jgi:hypothetical protein
LFHFSRFFFGEDSELPVGFAESHTWAILGSEPDIPGSQKACINKIKIIINVASVKGFTGLPLVRSYVNGQFSDQNLIFQNPRKFA